MEKAQVEPSPRNQSVLCKHVSKGCCRWVLLTQPAPAQASPPAILTPQ
jgi:hypothetical protein